MFLNFWIGEFQNAIMMSQIGLIQIIRRLSTYIAPFEEKYLGRPVSHINEVSEVNLSLVQFLREVNAMLTTVISKLDLNNAMLDNFGYAVWSIGIIIFFVYAIIMSLCFIYFFINGPRLYVFFSRLLYLVENEFGAPWILIMLTLVLSSTLVLGWIFPVFDINLPVMFTAVFIMVTTVVILVILVPISLIFNWGFYAPIYIKGQSIKKNLIVEVLTDYIHFISFFLRINIQLIRLVILSAVFYMYNEMYYEFIYPSYNINALDFNPTYLSDYIYMGLQALTIVTLNTIYEISHFWILLLMQSNAFGVIVFIITQFLYTIYLLNRTQLFFKSRSIRHHTNSLN